MTITAERPSAEPSPQPRHATGVLRWITTTDHKVIGLSYIVTSLIFFAVGGLLALAIRTELAAPGQEFLDAETYNQFFTMHGSVMIYLFAVPFAFGLANYIVPLQIGAPDMAFPRLNALGYWMYLFGGTVMISGFLTAGGSASFGWFAYAPLSGATYSPGIGPDLWIVGVIVTSTAGVLTAVNLVTTIFMLRAPGMTMFRMPIFTWNMLVTSVMVLLAFPVLTAALAMLFADRRLDAHIFDVTEDGTPVLWQHLFWFFGHPEVYIIALPFFGVITEIIPVFSRRPVFAYKGLILATLAIGGLSVGVWAHHMFATGVVSLPFFSALSLLIAVPTGVKFFNWIGTMWKGQITYQTPMLFVVGSIVIFLLGGLTGVLQAMAPLDFSVTDTYFVVAHMHYVAFATAGFAGFGAIYYWYPKFTGRMLDERLGKIHFALLFVGFNVTFFVQHELGLRGMPRRVNDYKESDGFTTLNVISTVGAFIIAIAVMVFAVNLWRSRRRGEPAGDDPWGGQTLEWATSSPPPEHNFDSLPPIRSERPVWDARHPDAPAFGHAADRVKTT
ncbi:MAG TPA: cytochrome c oxidase subunit I [Acidimicrobiia bacterium]|nr:cytochrome c oxidase subunit I [Acidimicrobiia bacterium]